MNQKFVLLLGGVRSGKSSYAEKLAAQQGQDVLFVATAQALGEEMRVRIEKHQQSRPVTWRTLEAPLNVGDAIRSALDDQPADVVLLDCLTLLVSNLLLHGLPADAPDEMLDKLDYKAAQGRISAELDALLEAFHATQIPWIVVSNEVGMGLAPPYPLGRLYRDLLGWANQRLAAAASEVLLMVAGLPVNVKALGELY